MSLSDTFPIFIVFAIMTSYFNRDCFSVRFYFANFYWQIKCSLDQTF
jgi:hypothetical protein